MSIHIQHRDIPNQSTNSKIHGIRHMHKYVLGMLAVLILFMVSFPLAYIRVSQSSKYGGNAFKSLNWEESQRDEASYVSSPRGK